MTTNKDLLPCPFCGGAAFDWRIGGYDAAQCDNSGAGENNCPLHKIKFTVESWNTLTSTITARLSAAEGLAKALEHAVGWMHVRKKQFPLEAAEQALLEWNRVKEVG